MFIHELPSASPSASEYIPIDNGTATRKATLSSIDMGSNQVTFTSGDTTSPASWQTVAALASNTASNLMASISKMIANIRWLYNRLGTSSTGTTATTVTGAIAEHSTKIGSADMGTTATTLTGAIAEVNDSVNTNTEDIATLNSNLTPTTESIITAASGFTLGISWQYRSGKHHWGYLEVTGTIPAGSSSTKVAQSSVTPLDGVNKFFVAEFTTSRWTTDIVMGNCFMPIDGGFFVTTATAKSCAKIWYDFMSQ